MKLTEEQKHSIPFQYAYNVLSNKIVTGKLVKKSVERFFKLIDQADQKGYRLDHIEGITAIEFFEYFLVHTKGPVSGKPFTLSPYQQFTLYNIIVWKKQNSDGVWVRVIKTVFEKVARKNGKTAFLAGLGLYFQCMDGESSPEIYVGATKEAQAKILWEQAFQFVFKSIKLRRSGFKNTTREIRYLPETGYFRFLGGDSKTQDGLNPNFAAIDEYHAHPNDGVREVLESAMGARLQPIMYIITTAGFNMFGVCKAYEDVCVEILNGYKQDDSTFIMIHDLDVGDDWEDQNTWLKANPNLGYGVSLDYLKSEFQKAKNQPSKIPNFKTKHLNLYVDSPDTWIEDDIWAKNKVDSISNAVFHNSKSYAALDLSTTTDISAYVAISEPDEHQSRYLKGWFFCPLDTIDKRSKEDNAPYREWMDAGYLIATPGNVIDYDYIEDKVKETYTDLGVIEIEVDPWNATQIMTRLSEHGLSLAEYSQGIGAMSPPTKEFEKLVYEGKLLHDGNPIFSWMLSGVVIYSDANDNMKVHKGQSHRQGKKRVDGIVAAIMCLGGSMSDTDDGSQSAYNNSSNEIYI